MFIAVVVLFHGKRSDLLWDLKQYINRVSCNRLQSMLCRSFTLTSIGRLQDSCFHDNGSERDKLAHGDEFIYGSQFWFSAAGLLRMGSVERKDLLL